MAYCNVHRKAGELIAKASNLQWARFCRSKHLHVDALEGSPIAERTSLGRRSRTGVDVVRQFTQHTR